MSGPPALSASHIEKSGESESLTMEVRSHGRRGCQPVALRLRVTCYRDGPRAGTLSGRGHDSLRQSRVKLSRSSRGRGVVRVPATGTGPGSALDSEITGIPV